MVRTVILASLMVLLPVGCAKRHKQRKKVFRGQEGGRGTLEGSNDALLKEMRFNKFACVSDDRTLYDELCPLRSDGYPVSNHPKLVTAMLQQQTNAISVVDAEDDNEVEKYSVEKLINDVGGLPTHPTSGPGTFWDQLEHVIEMRQIKPKKKASVALAEVLPLPDRWENYTVADVAEAVHDEYPGLHQAEFLNDLIAGKYGNVTFDHKIIPKRSNAQFLRGMVMLAVLNTWSIGIVGPYNFAAKWYAGRCRPEEVVWAISKGTAYNGVPYRIRRKIYNLELSSAEEFTAYPEGCPRHPSWPAMHSAASSMSFWLRIVLNLTPEQFCQAKKVDFAVACARTIAGVHYEDDNTAGLKMGQLIVAKELPYYLSKKYGSSTKKVSAKIKKNTFSWDSFDPSNPCPELDA